MKKKRNESDETVDCFNYTKAPIGFEEGFDLLYDEDPCDFLDEDYEGFSQEHITISGMHIVNIHDGVGIDHLIDINQSEPDDVELMRIERGLTQAVTSRNLPNEDFTAYLS